MLSRPRKITVAVLGLALLGSLASAFSAPTNAGHGRGSGPVVYVRSQGLYYDSIVVVDPLPAYGPFQLLEMGGNGLETEYGPGNRGYVGGRWKEDFDGDGTFHFFLCPLPGPGRSMP
jgi:hypothetical protein